MDTDGWRGLQQFVALILECIQLNKYYLIFCCCCYIIIDIIIMLIINPPHLHLHCHQQYQYHLSLPLTWNFTWDHIYGGWGFYILLLMWYIQMVSGMPFYSHTHITTCAIYFIKMKKNIPLIVKMRWSLHWLKSTE